MLVRLHAGFLHPMIHLGFGVEFQQPAIIAEALAQAAVHDNWIGYVLRDLVRHVGFLSDQPWLASSTFFAKTSK